MLEILIMFLALFSVILPNTSKYWKLAASADGHLDEVVAALPVGHEGDGLLVRLGVPE